MAGLKSGFVTGSRAIIKIDSKTIGFAVDVSYDIRIDHIPVETMGKYEVHTNEPVAYYVSGSFSVVRYTKDDTDESGIQSMSAGGNGGIAISHTDPGSILASKSFNLDIFEKVSGTVETPVVLSDKVTALAEGQDIAVFRVTDCRITGRRSVLMDQFTFVGILAGDMKEDGSKIMVANSDVTQGRDGE